MRRKLAYSNPVLTNSMAKLGSLPQGDWHVSKTGGKLFVGDTNWTRCAILDETVNEAEFHLNKTTSMLIQAQDKTTCRDIAIESKPAYDIYVVGGGLPGLLHRTDRAILISRRVTADETQKSSDGADQAYQQWFRGADGRIDLYRHGGRSAASASMGQYFARYSDDRHVFRDTHGHVIRRHRDEREGDHRGWLGHHARNDRMVVGRHIARQGRARDHTVHRMVQRRGLAGHASFGRRLLRQGHGGILALILSLGVAA